jgi:xanthine dehydrogenase accessory factor
VGTTGDAETDSKLTQVASAVKDGPSLVEEPFVICIQPVRSLPSLVIFGAGHVAVPVASLARLVGFRITVVDDRAEFANAQRFPQADRVLVANVDDAFNDVTIDGGTYVVVVTRGHALDEEVVAHALRTPAAYIGMIGSKRKVAAISQRLGDRGFTESDLARLHAPIGIEIGAETVEEIAISIVAQLVAVRRGVELPPVGHASAS